MNFVDVEPTLENYWRAIILFGRNTASYKFALAKSLIDVSLDSKSDLITLDDLALPYAMHLCEHLKHSPKQSTARSSKFIQACMDFNQGAITETQLIDITTYAKHLILTSIKRFLFQFYQFSCGVADGDLKKAPTLFLKPLTLKNCFHMRMKTSNFK